MPQFWPRSIPAHKRRAAATSASRRQRFSLSALLLFIKTQHYILIATTVEIEAIIHKLRVRLMDQVRHSELLPLDAIGRAEIVAAITKETATLTQATNMIAFAGQGVVLVFFVAIYIAYLSLAGLCAERGHRLRGRRDVSFQESGACRRNARGGGMGESAVRSADRPPGWLQGGEAQQVAQRRSVRRCR